MSVFSFIYYSFLNLKFSIQLIGSFGRACAEMVGFVICLAFVKHDIYFYFSFCCIAFPAAASSATSLVALIDPKDQREEERRKTNGGGVPINVLSGLKVSSLITTISLIVLDSHRRCHWLGMDIFLNEMVCSSRFCF